MKNITIKLITLAFLFGVIRMGSTNAYFIDSETIVGSTMTIATWSTSDNQELLSNYSNNYQILAPALVKKPIFTLKPVLTPELVVSIISTPIVTPVETPVVTPVVTPTPIQEITPVPTQILTPVVTPETSPEVTPEPTLSQTILPITPDLSLIGGICIE